METYVDRMPWVEGVNFAYADPITPNAELALLDAWYELTIDGTTYRVQSEASNYAFDHDETIAGYQADMQIKNYDTADKKNKLH